MIPSRVTPAPSYSWEEGRVRMLFTFVGGAGHYQPLAPVARAARAAGHAITFACRPSMTACVEADGFGAVATGPDVPDLRTIAPLAPPDPAREERVLREGFARRTALRRAKDIVDLCGELRPDAVVSDEVDYGAIVAAERLGLVHASVMVLVAGSFGRRELLAEPLNEVRAQQGLGPDPDLEMLSRYLVLAPLPPSFRDPAFPLPPTAHAIRPAALEPPGPGQRPSWLDELDERPTVYFTLGTIFNMESGDLFPRVLAGLAELDVNVIATVGPQLAPAPFAGASRRVHVERFVPQAHVLPCCDLVVSHGGSGSVMGALCYGLPSVLLPMGADQSHNGARCRQLGVGRVLDASRATPAVVRDAVAALLGDRASRRRAEALREEIAALPDPASAVALLEELRVQGRPIPAR
jgi:UDP:flavonoid glycosyltransferase YjiC (YdhE family)